LKVRAAKESKKAVKRRTAKKEKKEKAKEREKERERELKDERIWPRWVEAVAATGNRSSEQVSKTNIDLYK
jgi:hypothetical protein